MDKNSLSPKQRTICEKFLVAIRTTVPYLPIRFSSQQHHQDAAIASAVTPSANVRLVATDRCARVSKPETQNVDVKRYPKVLRNSAQEKAIVLPIQGNENRFPSIGEIANSKSTAAESINRMFTDYIHRTRQKFDSIADHQPGKIASFNEGLGAKERRLKK